MRCNPGKTLFILFILLLLFSIVSYAETDQLYPVFINGYWGYVNDFGKLAIQPQYNYASIFRSTVALIGIDDNTNDEHQMRYGLIDHSGDYILLPEWRKIDEKLDSESNDYIGGYEEGYYLIQNDDGLFGFYDILCETVCYPKWHYILIESDMWSNNELILVTDNTYRYGYVDHSGNLLIPCMYIAGRPFNEGYALVRFTDVIGEKNILIDKDNNSLEISDDFIPVDCFFEGLAPVINRSTSKYGYIDKSGKLAIEAVYDDVRVFREGKADVKIDGVWHYIDHLGNILPS